MSRAPTQQPKKPPGSSGSRSFLRRQRLQRERVARRRSLLARSGRPAGLGVGALKVLRRVPAAAWVCALIALLNATAWSIITPPFQGRDEVDHFAYVAHLAETGGLPTSSAHAYPPGEQQVLNGLHYGEVRFTPYLPSISSEAEQRSLQRDVAASGSLIGPAAGGTTSEPPFFYALQTIPFSLASGNVLNQLQLMRLLDALFGALTVLLVFLFLREVLPAVPWAATVAAICIALQPTFAFVTGSLNPDALIFALSAAVFLCLARAFRRGLTVRLALVLGLTVAVGLVTYLSFVGVAAGAFFALLLIAIRDLRSNGRRGVVAPGIALAIGGCPIALDWIVKTISGSAAFGSASTVGGTVGNSLFDELSYAWQLFLPRLPGMTHYFAGLSTWRQIWFDRSVGLYGWMDTMFPSWVDSIALVAAAATAVLCIRELIARRRAIRARFAELSSYAAITIASMAVIGFASYHSDVIEKELAYGEPRYLLPMIALLGAAIALAVRGAGRRLMPVAGAAMVVLFLGHDIFSQLQVIARFYG